MFFLSNTCKEQTIKYKIFNKILNLSKIKSSINL